MRHGAGRHEPHSRPTGIAQLPARKRRLAAYGRRKPQIRQSHGAGLDLVLRGRGRILPASVPASTRGVGVGDRKAGTGMSANEPRRIARRREPMFNAPVVVLGLIAVLIGDLRGLQLGA